MLRTLVVVSLIILLMMQPLLGLPALQLGVAEPGTIRIPEGLPPGVYDLIIELADGRRHYLPKSLYVERQLGDHIRIAHVSDEHYFASPTNIDLRVAGYLLAQLVSANVVVSTGDLADGAAAPQYIQAKGYWYAFLYPLPILAVPGNHDARTADYENHIGPRNTWWVINGTILVASVDTGERGTPSIEALRSLESVLSSHAEMLKVALFHHPLFRYIGEIEASHDSPNICHPSSSPDCVVSVYWGNDMDAAKYMVKLLEEYNITLTLSGHIHRDQYNILKSNRTGARVLMVTTTTLGQSGATYNGLQIIDLYRSGEVDFPIRPPTFVGFGYGGQMNSIPVDPKWVYGAFSAKFVAGGAYFFNISNTMFVRGAKYNLSGDILIALPWLNPSPNSVKMRILDSYGGASVELKDAIIVPSVGSAPYAAYILLRLDVPYGSWAAFAIYDWDDAEPPRLVFSNSIPGVPRVNYTNRIIFRVLDDWGLRSFYVYQVKDLSVVEELVEKLMQSKYPEAVLVEYLNELLSPVNTMYSGDTVYVTLTVRSTTSTNVTLLMVAQDLALKTRVALVNVTLYTPDESGPFIYGELDSEPAEPYRTMPPIDSWFPDPSSIIGVGPGSPVIARPGASINLNLSKDVKEVRFRSVAAEDGRLRLVEGVLYPQPQLIIQPPETATPTQTQITTATTPIATETTGPSTSISIAQTATVAERHSTVLTAAVLTIFAALAIILIVMKRRRGS